MICDSCKENIEEVEIRDLHGQALCEDCYMDRLSPAKPCDPWAVFTANLWRTTQDIKDFWGPGAGKWMSNGYGTKYL